ncbi:MFS transporter [Lentzea sp. NPDC058450]|uniref:MFS transporter n=1 Tax=Lentzea sp. NPDC058450 TaxID=3346505 RepID=UPI00365CB781
MVNESAVAPHGTRTGKWFGFVVIAHAVSTAGNYLNLVALGLFTYEVTGSGLGVGLLMALRLAAGALGGVVAGRCAGRFGGRAMMIAADIAQAAAMVVLVLAADDVLVPAAAVVVLGAGNAVFSVALRTSVPEWVGQAARVRANSRLMAARSLGTVAGFGSAGVVISSGGFGLAFTLNAASFALSACMLALVRPRNAHAQPVTTHDGRRFRPSASFPVLLLGMVALRGVDALASSSHNVALPVLASTIHAGDASAFLSRFWLAWAAGALLAQHVVRRWWRGHDPATGERLFAIGTCVMAVAFAAAFTGMPTLLLLLLALTAGLADGVTDIAYTSRLQETPHHLRGRLFGWSATAETSGFAVGMVTAGVALEVLPAVAVVALFHGLALCAAAGFLLFRNRGERE